MRLREPRVPAPSLEQAIRIAAGTLCVVALVMVLPHAAATNVGGTISTDTTWTFVGSPYVVTSTVTINGAAGADGVTTLTIEPGVQVLFNANTQLVVGGTTSTVKGALDARGTELSPILFSSNQVTKTRGFWAGIVFQNFANDTLSFVENVTVEYAGSNGVYLNNAEPRLRNATFREASTYGVRIDNANPVLADLVLANNTQHGAYVPSGGSPTFHNATFRGNGQYGLFTANGIPNVTASAFEANQRPLRMHVESLLEGTTFAGHTVNEIDLVATPSALLTKDRTLAVLADAATSAPLPYVVVESFTVRGTDGADGVTTLTLPPGAELRFNGTRALTIGGTTAGQVGALDARGTSEAPILLTSNQANKTRGFWNNLTFNDHASDALSFLENVTIEYAGTSAGLYLARAEPTIRSCIVRQGSGVGARVDVANARFEGCEFSNNTQHGASVPVGGSPVFANNRFVANGQYGLHVANGIPTITGNVFALNAQRPLRMHVDSVYADNVLDANVIQEAELMATPSGILSLDRTLPRLVDATNGTVIPWVATASFTVRGNDGADDLTTLTLEPGVELRFASGVALDVGTNTAGQVGALVARGTAEAPILLTSSQATSKTRGFWSQLRFYDNADDATSVLENVTIEYGGSSASQNVYVFRSLPTLANIVVRESGGQGIYLDDTSVTLAGSIIERNTASGIYVRTGSPTITRNTIANNTVNGVYTESGVPAVFANTFHNNTQRPMRVDYDSRLDGNAFSDDDIAEVELVGTASIDTDQRLVALPPGYAYVFAAAVRVQGGAGEDELTTLTIDPGVEARFRSAGQLVIGGSTSATRGALDARGTEEAPIVLTSGQAPGARTAGWWRNVYFDDGAVDNASFLENASIDFAGNGFDGALHLDRHAPAMRNVSIRFANGHGIESYETAATFRDVLVEGGGGSGAYAAHLTATSQATLPTVDGLRVVDYNGRVLYTAPDAALRGITASNVTVRIVDLASQSILRDATWPRVFDESTGAPVAYVIGSTIDMSRAAPDEDNVTTLTIEPGAVVKFSYWAGRLIVGANLPSALDARGTAELPIVFTSAQATPAQGDWGRIEFQSNTEDALSALENVTVEYGGGYCCNGAIYVDRALPTFRNNLVRHNELYGLRLYDSPLDIRGSTFESNGATNGYAIYAAGGSTNRHARMQLVDVTIANTTGRPARILPDTLLENVTFRGNSVNELDRTGGYVAFDTTWDTQHDADTGAPLTNLVTGWVTIAARDRPSVATLTIAPGTTMSWDSGGLEIGDPWVLDTAATRLDFGDYAYNATGVRFLNGTQDGGGCESVVPDVLGYTCAIIPFGFVDINATGTQVTLGDDQVSPLVPIGFNFTFYGRTHDRLYISSNGFVSFSESWEDGCCSGQDLPDPYRPNDLIAGYWSDLDPRLGGAIAYQTIGEAPERSFIVQFTDIQHYSVGGYNTTFQIVLREGSNAAEVHLLGVESDGDDHVTGVESPGILVGHGRLLAEGTPEAPILLTSYEPTGVKTPGSWSGLDVNEATLPDSLLANATIEYASGAIYAYQGAMQVRDSVLHRNRWEGAYLEEAPMRLERVLIEGTGDTSSSYGVYVWQGDARLGRAELVDVEIRNTSGIPLAIGADTLLERVTMRNSSVEEIEVSYGWATRDARWAVHHAADTGNEMPYVLTDYAYIAGDDGADGVTTLTIDPGVDVRSYTWGGMVVGDYGGPDTGALDARGTAADPITFRGYNAVRGQWYAIEFAETSDDARSFLQNVTIEHGGRGRYGALYVYNASPTIRDVVIRTSDTIGIYLEDAATTLDNVTVEDTTGMFAYGLYADDGSRGARLRDVSIRSTGGKPLAIPADAWIEGVELMANSRNEVDLWGGPVTHDAQWQGLRDLSTGARVPYVVDADVDVTGSLRVLADAEARFDQGVALRVGTSDALSGGALDARGTASYPIRFTSSQPEGIRSAAWWSGVEVLDGSLDAASRLENVTIEYAGASDAGGVRLDRAAPSLRGNVLQHNGAFSIHAREAHGAELVGNVLRRSAVGLHLENTTAATLRGNVVSATLDPANLTNVSASQIRGNRFASDDGVVRLVDGSSGNVILDNNFTRALGGSPVLDDGSGNVWTSAPELGANVVGGPTLGGNYYSDYAGFDLTDPSDGIGDTGLPYLLPGAAGAGDLYPLVTRERWRSIQGAPETVAFLLGELGETGWYNGTVQVQLVATDIENDTFVIRASLDGGTFTEYTAPILATGAGYHTVDYYAVDSVGNTESLKRVTFRLDPVAPLVGVDLEEEMLDDLCGALDASDAHAGLAELRWSVLDATGAYVVNATNVTLAGILATPGERVCADLAIEGRYLLRATAIDHVGIVAEAETPLTTIDIAAPILEILSPKARHVHAGPIATERPADPEPEPAARASLDGARELRPHLRAHMEKEHVPRAPIAPRLALAPPQLPLDDAPIVVGTTDVEAVATDAGSGIALGELLIDGELVANATSSPFRWTIELGSLAPGWHNVTVVAHDAAGHSSAKTMPFYYVGAEAALPEAPPAPTLATPTLRSSFRSFDPQLVLS